MNEQPHTLLLALGNDLLGDDAVGLEAAREIARCCPDGVEIVEAAAGGFALLDLLEGYRGAVIVDAVATGAYPPGTVREVLQEEFDGMAPASPHYAGLPHLMQLAVRLGMTVPERLKIIAMEVEDPHLLHEGLSETARAALPDLVLRVRAALTELVPAGSSAA
jgi:hydrogenase maturation protease